VTKVVHTVKSRAVLSSTFKNSQTVYEGKTCCLCIVTFGQKSSKLNSRLVYCSRLYGLSLNTQPKIQMLNGLNLSYAAATLFGKIFRHSSTIVSRYFWRTFTGILPAESESITGFLKETTLDTVWAFRVVLPFLNPMNKKI
jgi:hypothetical protein